MCGPLEPDRAGRHSAGHDSKAGAGDLYRRRADYLYADRFDRLQPRRFGPDRASGSRCASALSDLSAYLGPAPSGRPYVRGRDRPGGQPQSLSYFKPRWTSQPRIVAGRSRGNPDRRRESAAVDGSRPEFLPGTAFQIKMGMIYPSFPHVVSGNPDPFVIPECLYRGSKGVRLGLDSPPVTAGNDGVLDPRLRPRG